MIEHRSMIMIEWKIYTNYKRLWNLHIKWPSLNLENLQIFWKNTKKLRFWTQIYAKYFVIFHVFEILQGFFNILFNFFVNLPNKLLWFVNLQDLFAETTLYLIPWYVNLQVCWCRYTTWWTRHVICWFVNLQIAGVSLSSTMFCKLTNLLMYIDDL